MPLSTRYGVLNDEDSDDDDRFYSKKKPPKKSPNSSSGNSPVSHFHCYLIPIIMGTLKIGFLSSATTAQVEEYIEQPKHWTQVHIPLVLFSPLIFTQKFGVS